jgi:hypothetical protein
MNYTLKMKDLRAMHMTPCMVKAEFY